MNELRSSVKKPSKQEMIDFYRTFRTIEPEDIDVQQIVQKTRENSTDPASFDAETAEANVRLSHKIVRQVDEATWLDYVDNGTLPPIKLTPKEMELARGGLVATSIVIIGGWFCIWAQF